MTVVSPPLLQRACIPRQRERRTALTDLLTALTRVVSDRHDVSLMRGLFEESMRRALPIRTIQLRDRNSRWTSRPGTGAGIESIALEVPGSTAGGVIEATFDPGSGLGEWDFQLLGLAAHVAAFVLELERARLQLARAGLGPPVRMRRDGAAPLIARIVGDNAAVDDGLCVREGEKRNDQDGGRNHVLHRGSDEWDRRLAATMVTEPRQHAASFSPRAFHDWRLAWKIRSPSSN